MLQIKLPSNARSDQADSGDHARFGVLAPEQECPEHIGPDSSFRLPILTRGWMVSLLIPGTQIHPSTVRKLAPERTLRIR